MKTKQKKTKQTRVKQSFSHYFASGQTENRICCVFWNTKHGISDAEFFILIAKDTRNISYKMRLTHINTSNFIKQYVKINLSLCLLNICNKLYTKISY